MELRRGKTQEKKGEENEKSDGGAIGAFRRLVSSGRMDTTLDEKNEGRGSSVAENIGCGQGTEETINKEEDVQVDGEE